MEIFAWGSVCSTEEVRESRQGNSSAINGEENSLALRTFIYIRVMGGGKDSHPLPSPP